MIIPDMLSILLKPKI